MYVFVGTKIITLNKSKIIFPESEATKWVLQVRVVVMKEEDESEENVTIKVSNMCVPLNIIILEFFLF